jgi:hypothetical protein
VIDTVTWTFFSSFWPEFVKLTVKVGGGLEGRPLEGA